MPDKKKSTAAKTEDGRIAEPQASGASKRPEPIRTTAAPSGAAAAMTEPWGAPEQLATFEAAVRHFHARELQQARTLFQRAAEGPERDVAHRARLHIAMCDRRLQQETVAPRTGEDYYNYGIALINQRKLAEAREHLRKALELAPGADHVYYALAAAQALSGDVAGAHENLKRAIEIEPRNRILARRDGDFASVAGQPPFVALLYPEKRNW
jgi:tetratricopeptide (TPR) repeat protein